MCELKINEVSYITYYIYLHKLEQMWTQMNTPNQAFNDDFICSYVDRWRLVTVCLKSGKSSDLPLPKSNTDLN